jgi:hypothetical protein
MDRFILELTEGELQLVRALLSDAREAGTLGKRTRAGNSLQPKLDNPEKIRTAS